MANAWESAPVVGAGSDSYKDPDYDRFEAEAAKKTGVSPSILKSIRTAGEKTNRDKVSSAGAKSVYQIIPETRDRLKKIYGVDAYASDADAALAASYLMKENLARNKGNVEQAIGEYHGGTDRKQWGPVNKAYRDRTTEALGMKGKPAWASAPFADESAQPTLPSRTDLSKFDLTYKGQESVPLKLYRGGPTLTTLSPRSALFAERTAAAAPSALLDLPNLLNTIPLTLASKIPGAIGQRAQQALEANQRTIAGLKQAMGVPEPGQVLRKSGEEDPASKYIGSIADFLGVAPVGALAEIGKGVAPVKAIMSGTLTSVTGGATATEAGKAGKRLDIALGGDGKTGEALGQIVTPALTGAIGLSAANAAVEKAGQGLSAMKLSGLSKEAQRQAAHDLTRQELLKQFENDPKAAARAAQSEELVKQFPELKGKLGVARETGAPGLVAEYQQMLGSRPDLLTKGMAQQEAIEDALKAGRERIFPGGTKPFMQPVQAQRQAQLKALDTKETQLNSRLNALADKVPTVPKEQIGEAIRDTRDRLYRVQMDKSSALLGEATQAAAKQGIRPDVKPLVDDVKSLVGADIETWQKKPGVIGEILSKYGKAPEAQKPAKTVQEVIVRRGQEAAGKEVSFDEYYSLRKRVGEELGNARYTGDRVAEGILSRIYGNMENQLKAYEDPKFGDFYKKYMDFKTHYKTEVVPNFLQGVGGKLDKTNRFGEVTADEKVISGLIKSPTGMKEALAMVGNDPVGKANITKGIIDDFARSTGASANGIIDPKKAKAYIESNKDALKFLPDVKRNLESLTTSSEMILTRRGQIINERKAMNKDLLSNYLGTHDPDAMVGEALKRPFGLTPLVQSVAKDKDAAKSLAQTVATHISAMDNPQAYLLANEKDLKPLMDQLGPKHWNNLKLLAQGKEVAGRVKVPTHVQAPIAEDIGEQLTGTKASTLMSRLLGTNPILSKEKILIDLGNKFFFKTRKENMAKMREAMFFNPDVSEVLADIQRTGATKNKVDQLRAHMLAHGIRIIGVGAAQHAREKDEQ